MTYNITRLTISDPWLTCNCRLAEGPLYHKERDALHFVDIDSKQIQSVKISDKSNQRLFQFDDAISVMALVHGSDDRLIVAAKHGFAELNFADGEIHYVARVYKDRPGIEQRMRFNDGAVDVKGRLWAGTMLESGVESDETALGTVFRYDPDGKVHAMMEKTSSANGMGWSPDNKIMYLADSSNRRIDQFDFDQETGHISNRREFVSIDQDILPGSKKAPVPDGLAVDINGGVWTALYNGAKLLHFTAEGKLNAEIHLPALKVTCPVFGGDDMDELFVTTAALDDDEVEAKSIYRGNGDIYRVNAGVQGLAKYRFGRTE